jgi:predicted NBD/HSP70 family sugar kinase
MAGIIDDKDSIALSPNIPVLNNVSLGTLMWEATGKPALVFNDMEAGVIGMSGLMGDDCTGVTWSTGVGMATCHDGKVLYKGEAGHVPFLTCRATPRWILKTLGHRRSQQSHYKHHCGCLAKKQCFEAVCGGGSIRRLIRFLGGELPLYKIPQGVDPCAFLDQEYDSGSDWAQVTYHAIAYDMGVWLATILAVLRPSLICWKGSFAFEAIPRIEEEIRASMRLHLPDPGWERGLKFELSPAPDRDGLLGAALLFEEATT